jgi:hypothetical protein
MVKTIWRALTRSEVRNKCSSDLRARAGQVKLSPLDQYQYQYVPDNVEKLRETQSGLSVPQPEFSYLRHWS